MRTQSISTRAVIPSPTPLSAGPNPYLRTVALQRQVSHRENSQNICRTLLIHLCNYAGHEVRLRELTESFIRRFATHLLRDTPLQPNSVRTYLQKLHAILEEAVRQRLLPYNPMPFIGTLVPHDAGPSRAFLTTAEILLLARTPCRHPAVRRAFLFACFTGLRLSDIETQRWEHLHTVAGVPTIVKLQKKTRTEIRIPLNREAQRLLDEEPRREGGPVFCLPSRSTIAADLTLWSAAAALGKHLTFHVSRHTFATLLLTAGVGIYTVSRLCGHRNIRTTEIYAHIIDSTLQDGVARVSTLFDQRRPPHPDTIFLPPSQ
ncbi:MAG: site-specific integrase [Bacteroidales bacterium]|nr:site-specific integrase [Bacteroidales bacterium]